MIETLEVEMVEELCGYLLFLFQYVSDPAFAFSVDDLCEPGGVVLGGVDVAG